MEYVKLVEAVTDYEDIFKKIEKDCKPFLKHKRAIWRGLDIKGKEFDVRKVRKDRKPLGDNQALTDFTNAFIDSKNLPNRSRSVFGTTKEKYTAIFGNTCLLFPKGNFKHVWFPGIDDMNSHRFEQFAYWLKKYVDPSVLKKPFKDQLEIIKKQIIRDDENEDGLMTDINIDMFFVKRAFDKYVTALESYNDKTFPIAAEKNKTIAVKAGQTGEIIIDCNEYYYLARSFSIDDTGIVDQAIKRFNLK
jgi:hypothetical protein